MKERHEQLYLILAILFCLVAALSNLLTGKLFISPFSSHFPLPAGLITYPITFLISDLVVELYGSKKARFMILLGFGTSLVSYFVTACVLALPAYDAINQAAFEQVFQYVGPALYSSMSAFLVSQMLDIKLYEAIKKITGGRHLWLRNSGSTLISQACDTFIVTFIFFYFGVHMNFSETLHAACISFVYKAAITFGSVPLFYLIVAAARKNLRGAVKV